MRYRQAVLAFAVLASAAEGQTLVDLKTQSKSVDFSGANTTKPFKSGTNLPATCSVGEAFFQTNAPAGANFYACTALNSWTLEGGLPGVGPTGPAGPQGAAGPTGPAGAAGAPGAAGATGSQGSAGASGAPGAAGATGPQGSAGAAGPTGPSGAQGAAGSAGSNGALSRVQNAGTNLPVQGTLNFTGGGCTDDSANGRTNCTGAGISGLNIAVNGTTQGTQATLNLISGSGVTETCSNNSGANRVDCTPSLNTAVALTIANSQAGKPDFCNSANGTDAYTCSLNASAVLTAYTTGMHLTLNPDATNTGASTLNVDGVGIRGIKQSDGLTDPASGQIAGGRAIAIYFDGAVWRLPAFSGVGICDSQHLLNGSGNCVAIPAISNQFYVDSACAALGHPQCFTTINAAAAAAVSAGGGDVNMLVPGSYTPAVPLKLGSSAALGDATTTRVNLNIGAGVVIHCAGTAFNCIQMYEGSNLNGKMGYAVSAHGSNPTITVDNNAHFANIVAAALMDGTLQSIAVAGIEFSDNGNGLVDQAIVHIRGLFSSTVVKDVTWGSMNGTIGMLIDNPTSASISTTGMTGSGTTATATVAASTNATPEAHHVFPGQKITVSGCSDASFNGTNLAVLSVIDNRNFTYQGAGTLGSSATGCAYTPVTAVNITSVIALFNLVMNGAGAAGARPLVISSIGNGATVELACYLCDLEHPSPGGAIVEINGNGLSTSLVPTDILFSGGHFESASTDTTPTGFKIVDAHDVLIQGVNFGTCGNCTGGQAILIGATNTNLVSNIRLSTIGNVNWVTIINNTINNYTNKLSHVTEYMYAGASTSNSSMSEGDYCGEPSVICVWDHFLPTVVPNGSGSLGWALRQIGGTTTAISFPNPAIPFIGDTLVTTQAAAGDGGSLDLSGNSSTPGALGKLGNVAQPWRMWWIFRMSTSADTSFRIGFAGAGAAAAAPADGAWLRFDSNSACNGCGGTADATFKFESMAASSSSDVDTGQTPVIANFYKLSIENGGASNKLIFNLYSNTGVLLVGPVSFCPSGCNVTATPSTASMTPAMIIASATGGAGGAKTAHASYFGFKMWSLSR